MFGHGVRGFSPFRPVFPLPLYHSLVPEPRCPACWLPTHHIPAEQPDFVRALISTQKVLLCPFGPWKPHLPVPESTGMEGQTAPPARKPSYDRAGRHPSICHFCIGVCVCPSPLRAGIPLKTGTCFVFYPQGQHYPWHTGQAQQTVTDGMAWFV